MIKIKSIKTTEESELRMLVKWFCMQYPNSIIKTNYDHFKSSVYHAKRLNDLHTQIKGYPDIFISEVRMTKFGDVYGGLFIEFKRTGETILNKKQGLKTDHLKSQNSMLQKLNDLGYFAVFGLGFENTKEIIINYMNLEKLK